MTISKTPPTFHVHHYALALALCLPACAADDDEDAEAATVADADTDSESTGDVDIQALYDCEDPDFAVVMPLTGPGYDPATGLLEPVQDTYVVHTTQLLLKPDEQAQATFMSMGQEVVAQVMQSPGLIAVSLAVEPNCGFSRTLGIWRSEEDMYNFAASGAHAEAMGRTLEVGVTGKVTHWEANAEAMPLEWPAALERIAAVEPSAIY